MDLKRCKSGLSIDKITDIDFFKVFFYAYDTLKSTDENNFIVSQLEPDLSEETTNGIKVYPASWFFSGSKVGAVVFNVKAFALIW